MIPVSRDLESGSGNATGLLGRDRGNWPIASPLLDSNLREASFTTVVYLD